MNDDPAGASHRVEPPLRADVESQGGVPSPCNSVCRMNPVTGWCEGCFRTIDEIAAWGSLDDTARQAIVERLRCRSA